ncbi:MAG TPA: ATP-binding protein [Ktedonobacteraceae bacterium]|nr:ATP-binding protein [Ktedonobacteraceae bacterium]
MELPTKIDEWTYEKIVQLIMEDEPEPGLYDFKEALNPRKDLPDKPRQAMLDSLLRTVCGMANTDGGFIIFGVSDRASAPSPKDRIVGISLNGEERKQFGEKIKVIQRPIYFNVLALEFPNDNTKGFFVVHIPLSPLRPHMLETSDSKQFYRRGHGGHAVQMGFYEVRDQMLYTEERLRKVTLLRLVIEQYFAQVQKLSAVVSWNQSHPYDLKTVYFDTSAYMIFLNDASTFLPTSDDLLKDLLDIPVEANILQGIVMTLGPAKAQYNSATLHNLCNKCLRRLEELFGPLGSERRPSA